MVSLTTPKLDAQEDIKKIHDLLIPHQLHIDHNIYLFVFLSLANSFSQPYILIPFAIENDLFSEGISPSNKTLLKYKILNNN